MTATTVQPTGLQDTLDDEQSEEAQQPEGDEGAGRRLGVVMLVLGVLLCFALAAFAGYLSYRNQRGFAFANNGGDKAASIMFAALCDTGVMAMSLLGLAAVLTGRLPGRLTLLNMLFIGGSTWLNALSSPKTASGLSLAIVPPIAYAITFHTSLEEIRVRILSRRKGSVEQGHSVAHAARALLLWLARLLLAPIATLGDLRWYVLTVAPLVPFGDLQPVPAARRSRRSRRGRPDQAPSRRPAPAIPAARDGESQEPEPAAPSATAAAEAARNLARMRETAQTVYIAYALDRRAPNPRRLSQFTGYSTKQAGRLLETFSREFGPIDVAHDADDEEFAAQLAERLADGLVLGPDSLPARRRSAG